MVISPQFIQDSMEMKLYDINSLCKIDSDNMSPRPIIVKVFNRDNTSQVLALFTYRREIVISLCVWILKLSLSKNSQFICNFSVNMPAFVVEATTRIPNFKGIKFTSNDLSEAAQVKRNLKEDQEMFLGADTVSLLKNFVIN